MVYYTMKQMIMHWSRKWGATPPNRNVYIPMSCAGYELSTLQGTHCSFNRIDQNDVYIIIPKPHDPL